MVGLDLQKALEETDYLEPLQSSFNLEHTVEWRQCLSYLMIILVLHAAFNGTWDQIPAVC